MPFGSPQKRVYHSWKFDTIDQLNQAIVLEWRALPRRFIDHTICEWRRRLQLCYVMLCYVMLQLLFAHSYSHK